jgi:hypothetical protein
VRRHGHCGGGSVPHHQPMRDLASHHGEAEATGREDGGGQGSRFVLHAILDPRAPTCHFGSWDHHPYAGRQSCLPASRSQASLMRDTTFWVSMPCASVSTQSQARAQAVDGRALIG